MQGRFPEMLVETDVGQKGQENNLYGCIASGKTGTVLSHDVPLEGVRDSECAARRYQLVDAEEWENRKILLMHEKNEAMNSVHETLSGSRESGTINVLCAQP